ncbi:indole-3-glycerol-phosphate synthase [Aureococcus anophagefferens]|nr:indole-3-glycerol-phosphate synthase [Aureococcus anophagefferens]
MALVEVHTEAEMALALDCPGVECIGINNRNLHSFKLDMSTTERLMSYAIRGAEDLVFASLSGVSMRSEVVALKDVECVLVGEALMRSSDPAPVRS